MRAAPLPRLRRLVVALAATAAAAAAPAGAQAPNVPGVDWRGWNVCFQSAIGSCTELYVAYDRPDPQLDVTVVNVAVRHRAAPAAYSGLFSLGLTWDAAPNGSLLTIAPAPVLPQALDGAPPSAATWTRTGSVYMPGGLVTGLAALSWVADPGADAGFIAGCGDGVFDAAYRTSRITCGADAYLFDMALWGWTPGGFVAPTGFTLDVFAPDTDGDGLVNQASCAVALGTDGTGAGVGMDLGDPSTVALCTATPIAAVPEPGTLGLCVGGLLLLGAGALRRRRALASTPDTPACAA